MTAHSDERDIADYLLVLWAKRTLILACTGLTVVLTLIVSLLVSKIYRSTATLMLTGSKVPTVTVGEASRPDSRLFSETYAELIRSRSIASRVVRELKLAERPHPLDEDRLMRMLRVRAVPSTMLLTVTLDYQDPELAAQIVNLQTEQAVALSKSIGTTEITDTRRYLQDQVSSAKVELDKRQEALRDLKSKLQFDEASQQLQFLLKQRGELEIALAKAEQDADMHEAEARSMKKALASQDKIITLTRSVVDDPALREAAASGKPAGGVLGLQMKSQEINPLFAESEPLFVRAEARAAGAAGRRDKVRQQLAATVSAARRVERDLADKAALLNAAQRDHDLAKAAYENFSKSFENARLSVAAQAADLKIVDPAVPGTRPVAPRLVLNVAVAFFSSLILSVFAVIFFDYLRTVRRAPLVSRSAPEAAVGLRSTR